MCAHACAHTCVHVHACTCLLECLPTCICVCASTCMYVCVCIGGWGVWRSKMGREKGLEIRIVVKLTEQVKGVEGRGLKTERDL